MGYLEQDGSGLRRQPEDRLQGGLQLSHHPHGRLHMLRLLARHANVGQQAHGRHRAHGNGQVGDRLAVPDGWTARSLRPNNDGLLGADLREPDPGHSRQQVREAAPGAGQGHRPRVHYVGAHVGQALSSIRRRLQHAQARDLRRAAARRADAAADRHGRLRAPGRAGLWRRLVRPQDAQMEGRH